MANDQIFIGAGTEKFEGNLIEVSICLTDIPKEWITDYNGKKYLRIKVQKKRQPDQYGKTHSVSINTYKPEVKSNNRNNSIKDDPADDLPF
jgi:hypothetical protein